MPNLQIVINNPTPCREKRLPRTWMLYRLGKGLASNLRWNTTTTTKGTFIVLNRVV